MIHYQWEPRLFKPLVEAEILSGKDWALIAWGDNQNPPRNSCCFLDKDHENIGRPKVQLCSGTIGENHCGSADSGKLCSTIPPKRCAWNTLFFNSFFHLFVGAAGVPLSSQMIFLFVSNHPWQGSEVKTHTLSPNRLGLMIAFILAMWRQKLDLCVS